MNAREVFLAAVKMSPQAWPEYVAEACNGDEELCRRVGKLLQAHQDAGSFLSPEAPAAAATIDQAKCERAGTVIGPYELIEQIGEGGMGLVFVAEQHQPVRRQVALKVIKPGMDSRQVIARFEAERQALALMNHPNIAKVLDAGMTDTGRPYFVMELIRGIPITDYCDEARMAVRQRLEVFVQVCRAVQHAHTKGVIHRDLKPSNVLVTSHDGVPVPMIIDFGVAKALGQQLTDRAAHTGFAQMVGTPLYMSPEQAEFNQLGVDTRSDIYALGVLLYELLTGTTPFDRDRLKSAGFDEFRRILREEEPPRPSARLSTLGAALSTASQRRGVDVRQLTRNLNGELDWIVMKALEKDRSRRYETASGLTSDIQRYLNDEPVAAGPPTAAYRFRKFAQRNKAVLATASIVGASLALGLVGTSWQAIRATRAEGAALASAERTRTAAEAERQARESETVQRQKAEEAEKAAAEEAAVAKAVNAFLQDDLLGLADPELQLSAKMEADPDVKLVTLLDRALARLDERFADQPRIRVELQTTLADSFRGIGRYAVATQLYQQVVNYRIATLGREHHITLTAINNLATLYWRQHKYAEAEPLYTQHLEISRRVRGPEHPSTLILMGNLATLYLNQAKYAEAELLLTQCLEISRRVLGPDHADTAGTMNNLAGLYMEQGKYAAAEPLFTQCLEISRRVLGPEHPDTCTAMNNLAGVYWSQKKLDQSIPLYEQTLKQNTSVLGKEHPDTLLAMANLGVNYKDAGRVAEGLPLLVEAYRAGRNHPRRSEFASQLHDALVKADKLPEAVDLLKEQLDLARASLPDNTPQLAGILAFSGLRLLQLKAWADAELILRECLAIREQLQPDDWTTFNTRSMLGGALAGQQKYADAEPLLVAGYEGLRQRESQLPPQSKTRLSEALQRLVQLYSAWEKPEQAAQWQKQVDAHTARLANENIANSPNAGDQSPDGAQSEKRNAAK